MNLTEKALAFATAAHGEQKRKYTGAPYIEHPIRVAELVRGAGGTDEMIAAAYLHDVVEDVPFPHLLEISRVEDQYYEGAHLNNSDRDNKLSILYTCFGERVTRLVEMVTDVSFPSDGNRKARKQKDLEHLAQASPEGKTIKLADLIDNSKDIAKNDPDFAKVYMREKAALLPVLIGGNDKLWMRAKTIVKAWEEHELGEDGSK